MRPILFIIGSFLCFACSNTPSEKTTPQTALADSLLKQVIDVHDIAMPQMFKLERLKKEAITVSDSLKKVVPRNKEKIAELEQLFKELISADAAMQDWMNGFQYDTLKSNPSERVSYIEAQLKSATIMKNAVLNSIAKADTLLSK